MRYLMAIALLLGVLHSAKAQQEGVADSTQGYWLKGEVLDSATLEPMEFISVYISEYRYGATTDIEGQFNFWIPHDIDSSEKLIVSAIAYNRLEIPLQDVLGSEHLQLFISGLVWECFPVKTVTTHESKWQRMLQSPYSILILDREDVERWMW